MGILNRIFKKPGFRFSPDTDPSLGIEKIDRYHRHLGDLINQLQEAVKSKLPSQVIEDMFIELRDYAHFHFRLEAMILKKNNPKTINNHQDVHKKFITTINDLHMNFNSMKSPISPDSFKSLKSQLGDHINIHHSPLPGISDN